MMYRWLAGKILPYVREVLTEQLREDARQASEDKVMALYRQGHIALAHSETVKASLEIIYTLYETQVPGVYLGYLDLRKVGQGDRLTITRYIRLTPDGEYLPYEEEAIDGFQRAPAYQLPALYAPHGMRITLQLTGGVPTTVTHYWYRILQGSQP